jgi:glycosyltransferase involved in cell wall biosynthesis
MISVFSRSLLCDADPLEPDGRAEGKGMRCPTLAELPPPPSGKTGWPWTVETPPLPPERLDGSAWPRISIVTPSYNQGQFIEETIRSILLQGYPDLEYIIIDGGSTDQSVDIIKKYEPWLTHWVSEKDRGQAHAINKGFAQASGKIGAYLNSDDFYLPGALSSAAESFIRSGWDLFIGCSDIRHSPSYRLLRRSWWLHRLRILPEPLLVGSGHYSVSQESTLWNLNQFGTWQFDESLHFKLDADWYYRIARGAKIALSSRRIGHFRHHPRSKTATLQALAIAEGPRIWTKQENKRRIDYRNYEIIYSRYRRRLLRATIAKSLGRTVEFVYVHPE